MEINTTTSLTQGAPAGLPQHIINNAFAAVKDGGHIEISIRQMSEERVSVVVQDDGIGIPPENLKRIFEPYH
jgi:two-component system NtrC family sensor kinase